MRVVVQKQHFLSTPCNIVHRFLQMNYDIITLMNTILEKLSHVPAQPGVYVMRDSDNHIIYIGKAKDLKSRLSSYFRDGAHDTKTIALIQKIADFNYFLCRTENDALGLEANLIKKYKPHYNILLKDNKSFPYIRIVPANFPYIEVTRKLNQKGKYFGPYFNGIWAKELLAVIQNIFPVRCCSKLISDSPEPKAQNNTCLNHQIGKCSAPCMGKISQQDYAKIIEDVKIFLQGKNDFGAREILTKKMLTASDLGQFELAIKYRDGLSFLDKLKERTITQVGRDVNCDVFGCSSRADIFVVSVLTVRGGKLIGIQNYSNTNQSPLSEDEKLAQFVSQYYLENLQPEEVITSAIKGYKKKLIEMANENAKEYLDVSIEKIRYKDEFTLGACQELHNEIMGKPGVLKKIECYDISHFGGDQMVGSMVVFIDGMPEKKLYRKFRIRHKEGNNDVLSMKEVLTRRLNRLGTSDDSFGPPPDLIIVDGGKGQLSAALEAMTNFSYINVCAIAEKEEMIFVPNNPGPIVLSKRSYALRLVQRIRDEAHRFANDYRMKLKKQK